jgi:hypothetical protein
MGVQQGINGAKGEDFSCGSYTGDEAQKEEIQARGMGLHACLHAGDEWPGTQ